MEQLHDVTIKQTARFTLQGKVVPAVLVSYFIGDHGPFIDQFDEPDATPEKIKAAQARRYEMLRAAGATLTGSMGQ